MGNASIDSELASQLITSPSFLLLGQEYLKLDDGSDYILERIRQRINVVSPGNSPTYSLLLEVNATEPDDFFGWLQRVAESQAVPAWLEEVSSFPWNGVYTSGIDVLWNRAFRRPWREIERVYDEQHYPIDPRNRLKLHCTPLFGSIDQVGSFAPPLRKADLLKRKQKAITLLKRLPALVSPFGHLLIDGLNPNSDWLDAETLYPTLSSFGKGQVHVFSCGDNWNDELLKELAFDGIITLHESSLAEILALLRSQGLIPEQDEGSLAGEHRVRIGKKLVHIPNHVYIEVSRYSIVIEDSLFHDGTSAPPEGAYFAFRSFLANSAPAPIWSGYPAGFAFPRQFETPLFSAVKSNLEASELPKQPIILHGQTGAGKTIAMGHLAYRLNRLGTAPILYISRKSQIPDRQALDGYFQWCESEGATKIVVLWDGMLEPQVYQDFLNYCLFRGRKVILIGTSYRDVNRPKDNHIEAVSLIEEAEAKDFSAFLARYVPDSRQLGRHLTLAGSSFLSLLYRLLDPTRPGIRRGVREELAAAESKIRSLTNRPFEDTLTSLGTLLVSLGLYDANTPFSGPNITVAGESVSPIEDLTGLICVPGQFGLEIPVDLLLRTLGESQSLNFSRFIDTLDIFRWREDEAGNTFVSTRQALEARIVLQDRFNSSAAEVHYACRLIKETDWNYDQSPEEQFAMDLIRNMGPNSTSSYKYEHLWPIFYESLQYLRESRNVQSPRLMLQEALLRREHIKSNQLEQDEVLFLLTSSEAILENAISICEANPRPKLQSFLQAELATNLGFQLKLAIDTKTTGLDPRVVFKRLQSHVIGSRNSYGANINPIDVLGWASEDLLESELLDISERIEIEAWVLSMFDRLAIGELKPDDRIRVMTRLQSLYVAINREDMSQGVFDSLLAAGSTAGIYVRARSILGVTHDQSGAPIVNLEARENTVSFLMQYRKTISSDVRCLSVLLQSWWIVKLKQALFDGERKTLKFDHKDWNFVLDLCRDILGTEERSWFATARYVQGIALFHLGNYAESFEIFQDLSSFEEFSLASKRLIRSYLASTPSGAAVEFEGTVQWIGASEQGGQGRGELYVPTLRRNVPFFAFEFPRTQFKKGDSLIFNIGFNFRGPIADPIKVTR